MSKRPSQTGTSLRAFACGLKVSEKAVRKAVESGRLAKSIGRDEHGRPFVADEELARREWQDNAAKAPKGGKREGVPVAGSLADVQRRVALQRERKLRLENDERRGRLMDVARVQREAFEAARIIREAVLNLPARLSSELAAETDAARIYTRLDTELRQALGRAADQVQEARRA